MNELTLIVSRPGIALRANGSHSNYYVVAKARRAARTEAWAATLEGGGLAVANGETVHIQYTELLGPNARVLDDDNLIGAMKSARDGIALALDVDDRRFLTQPRLPPERGPRNGVRVKLWTVPPQTVPA